MSRFLALVLGLSVLLVQSAPSLACVGSSGPDLVRDADGNEYYEIKRKRFPPEPRKRFPIEEKNEYLFQRWPNIVIAELVRSSVSSDRKMEFFSFQIIQRYKGDLEDSFQSSRKFPALISSCHTSFTPNKPYLMFLPNLGPKGAFDHSVITLIDGPPVYLVGSEETTQLIKWLDERVEQEPESHESATETHKGLSQP